VERGEGSWHRRQPKVTADSLNRVISHASQVKGKFRDNFMLIVSISIQYAAARHSKGFWICLEQIYPYRVETSQGWWEF